MMFPGLQGRPPAVGRRVRLLLNSLLLLTMLSVMALAQSSARQNAVGRVAGTVTDPTGAAVVGASVTLELPSGPPRRTSTDGSGNYVLKAGSGVRVRVTVSAAGFAGQESEPMVLLAGGTRHQDFRLKIAEQVAKVDVVEDEANDTDPGHGGDAATLKGTAIDDLPLEPAQLLSELQALAGSPAPEIYVNGFSGGRVPQRDSIREIRINQNPYSAQNDTNPVNGTVQIFTRPGGGDFHGDFYVFGNDSTFNSLNPFVQAEPPYYSYTTSGSLSGPINKKASFFVNAERRSDQSNSVVSAQGPDGEAFRQAVHAPLTSSSFSARVDSMIGLNTQMLAYSVDTSRQINGGVGGLVLASQGYSNDTTTQLLQASNSWLVTPRVVNDTRFQYTRARVFQDPNELAPAVIVEGAFTGGGNNLGIFHDNIDRYELQNYVSAAEGRHYFTFGGRLRVARDANHSLANYDGEFIFASLAAYQATVSGVANVASQFNLTTGAPDVAITVADAGLFFQDDWKARPNLTLSYGLRFETQNHIADKDDWGPRAGFAWAVDTKKGKPGKYTVRGGAGIFYRRLPLLNVLEATRQNGVLQQEFVVNSPQFFATIPPVAALGPQTAPTIFQISPAFHAPYYVSSTASVERRLGVHGVLTLTYLNNRGVHSLLTRNINAPLPGTYDPANPSSGVRPLGTLQNIYQYESEGVYRTNRLRANYSLRFGQRFSVYGSYAFRVEKTDASGDGFPSNQYNIGQDYGRSPDDVRHEINMVPSLSLPQGFRLTAFLRARSGLPFNIVLDQDLNGDAQFNDRPAFATDLARPSVVATRWGVFDTLPVAGQRVIPYDYGTGPAQLDLELNASKTFSVGPHAAAPPGAKGKPGPRKDLLIFSVDAQNVLNHVNLGIPVGTLGSPLFGHSIALNSGTSTTANRLINLQVYFRF